MQSTSLRRPALTGAAALLVLLATATAVMLGMRPPSPAPAAAPADRFSATRAMEHVRAIAAQPHPSGTAAHARVLGYLAQQLGGLGWTLDPIVGTAANPRLGTPVPIGRVTTLVARRPGTAGTGTVYLTAHFDSVRTGPGANDDAAGVAALLEAARALSQGPGARNDLALVLTDGEEPGLLGARLFLDTRHPDPAGAVVVNLEARGDRGPALMFETSAANSSLIGHYADTPTPLGFSLSAEVYRRLPNDTDFTEWRDAGFAGLNVAYLDGSPRYHTPGDSAEHVDGASLQHEGELVLALARSLGDADLAHLDDGADTYFWTPLGLVRYPNGLVLPLAVAALLALAGLVTLARRAGQLSLGRYAVAFGTGLVPVIAAVLLAVALWQLAVALRPEYGAFVLGDTYEPGWYRAALTGAALLAAAGWWLLMRRRLGAAALSAGGLTWLGLLGLALALLAPGASYLFSLPVLVSAVAGGVALARPTLVPWWPIAVQVGALATLLVTAPVVALLHPALGLALGAAPAALIALLAVPALPLLDLLVPRRAGLVAAVAAVTVAALLAAGLVTDPVDADHPRPSHLLYAYDADSGTARWLSPDATPDAWTTGYLTGRVESVEPQFPTLVGGLLSDYHTGPAPTIALAPPELAIKPGATGAGSVVFTLRSTRSAGVLSFHVATDGPQPVAATVDGVEVPVDGAPARPGKWGWGFEFHALPSEGIEVRLRFAGSGPVTVRVTDRTDGFGDVPGLRPRPTGLAAGPLPTDATLAGKTFTLP
ncbi:M28 family peptidase [Catellatospora tritici]|uniref:M28 family peptidase n=1 Tax=Catellatospora tritici TaxID=2851566 RepID=UPI001C2D3C59|nr:M28 family peptidase [Catellatospora tritici]MBV1850748.1 M28 family peptidase [Catellatospora tritici]MBV1851001.1 M28 family peptidase [Catellatospora tritici]